MKYHFGEQVVETGEYCEDYNQYENQTDCSFDTQPPPLGSRQLESCHRYDQAQSQARKEPTRKRLYALG
jgi:hypothetical protein